MYEIEETPNEMKLVDNLPGEEEEVKNATFEEYTEYYDKKEEKEIDNGS